MSFTFSSVFDQPVREVFSWHERPGALLRLLPPWQPVRIAAEAESLVDGTAVLQMPLGIRWVAQHGDYRPGERFVDELTSLPFRWRHVHEFGQEPGGRTRLTDQVETRIPASLLRTMFTYRHRQLADDLRAHASYGGPPLTVAMTGSSGLVGSALRSFLTTGGHRVIRLTRGESAGPDSRTWRPEAPAADLLEGVDAVVHLAGAPIGRRFTASHKRTIRDSRVTPTGALAELIARQANPPTLVVASAIGYYGADPGAQTLTEDSAQGAGFLAELVADWEAASAPARQAGARVVLVRTGIVQSPRGGSLRLLRPLFLSGLGGRIGSGQEWTSWIDLDDLVDVYHRAIFDPAVRGAINAVAPQAVSGKDYAATLARVLRRPALLPVPKLAPAAFLGREGAHELALASQHVLPQRLVEAGHSFRRADLEDCLRHQLGHPES